MRRALTAFALALLGFFWLSTVATAAASALCEPGIRTAEQRYALPPGLLYAIARVEAGRSIGGNTVIWPWALNLAGQGAYPASKAEAMRLAGDHLRKGGNVDLGCLQISWRYHGRQLRDLERALDPTSNSDYAARFLRRLYASHGSWTRAVAFYHSSTPWRQQRYLNRVLRELCSQRLYQNHC